jgi:hypothetical protein
MFGYPPSVHIVRLSGRLFDVSSRVTPFRVAVGFGRAQQDGADPHPSPMIGAALGAQPQAV